MNPQGAIGMASTVFLFILFRKLFNNRRPNQTIPNEDSASYTPSFADSAATSSSLSGGEYEVFLSFRGVDTRTGFTDFLYTYLVGAGVRTFRDDNKLRIGEEIGQELLTAINESKILIPILSINYAASKWCMIELTQMVECHKNEGKMIFPIFYDIIPSDSRNKNGNYEKAFRQHEKKFGKITVQRWKDAMTLVGKLKGLELKKATNGHEGELVKMVVKEVMLVLKKNYTSLPDDLVGMDHHVKEMETLLDVNYNGARIVGILGMGGLGKTTISKAVFNRLCDSFDGSCFLDDVRERSKHHKGVVTLQSELVSKITKQELISIRNIGEGIGKIKDVVRKKKVLIVLDDVDAISQVNQLIEDCLSFGEGSKIMITTRNKDVLDTIEETCSIKGFPGVYKCYEPPLMNADHSLILFCNYAFKQKSPPQEYDILSKDFVSTASGLPLVLVTLGSLLFGKNDQTIWEEILMKTKKIPNRDVLKILRISFDALEHDQQQIFLDIACLLTGSDKRLASYMWDACGYYPKSGVDTLICRSLIKVGDDYKMRMHDQLIDLGKQIVREENLKVAGVRSRVWDLEEASDVSKGGLGSNNLEALKIEHDEVDPLCFVRQDFPQLQNLRYLKLKDVELHGDFQDLFPKLRFLEWISTGGEFIPTNLNLKNLVVLDLSIETFKDRREGWSLFEAKITQARQLKALVLVRCKIEKLSLSTFEDLEILEIENCNSLWEVAGLSKTKRLKRATFDQCNSLTEIQGLENLEVLELLTVKFSSAIIRLPDLSKLRMLKQLHLAYLINLREIWGLGGLVSLEVLLLQGCCSIMKITDLSKLRMLKELHLDGLENIRKIDLESSNQVFLDGYGNSSEVEDLGGLEAVHTLNIIECHSLERLLGLPKLKKLKQMNLSNCKKLTGFEGLNNLVTLEILHILSCDSLVEVLDFSGFKNLKTLSIAAIENLREIRGLEELESLVSLCVSCCSTLTKLSNLSHLTSLKHLAVSGCAKLTDVKCLGLVSLESLELRLCDCSLHGNTLESLSILGCNSMKNLPHVSHLTSLKHLSLSVCAKFIKIECFELVSLETLELSECGLHGNKLESLSISRCTSLRELPNLSHLTNLKELVVTRCEKLVEVKCFKLVSLESLELIGSLGNTLDLSYSRHLKKLKVHDLMNLTEIRGLEELIFLEVFSISYCGSLEKLPNLTHLKNLKDLGVTLCEKLVEVNCLRLVSLESLKLIGSHGNTLNISYLRNLKHLKVGDSMNLTEIKGLEELVSLEVLYISNCGSLEKLPDLSHLTNLKKLVVTLCDKVVEVNCLRLVSLENLELIGSLGNTLDISYSRHLKYLKLCDSMNLTEIKGLEELISLEVLDISNCGSLEKLPDLSKLTNLKTLYAMYCQELHEVNGVFSLVSLQYFYLSGYKFMYRTLDFSFFNHLKEVKISSAHQLTEIRGLEELKSLEKLGIEYCYFLEKLPDLSNLTKLEYLDLRGCEKLADIKGLNCLVSLVSLDLSLCNSMEKTTMDFFSLINLVELSLYGLKHLTDITGLEESASLQILNVSECKLLEKLPDLSNITSLRRLKIRGCVKLPKIEGLSSSVSIEDNDE